VKITTLIENTAVEGAAQLKPEHGISLFIEHRGKNILFDTGSSDLFARNAEALGIDLKRVDFLVLSHAHFDHAGGLARFMELNPTAPVVLLSRARQETYLKILFIKKYIGIDRKLFDTHAARFRFFDDPLELSPGVSVMANTVQEEHRPSGNRMLYIRQGTSFVPDPFNHELILVMDEDDGSVVFTGCSHNGILNMLASVYRLRPGIRIKAVFGGFHLMNPITKKMSEKPETVESIAAKLKSLPAGKIYTGHCTGPDAFALLKKGLGDRVAEFTTGMAVDI
jgi:7,8-dihydropterin-6-yl-methyl-4-(beta-D-ribofuranosyl)aminobenzene 5'-phosphate synthase